MFKITAAVRTSVRLILARSNEYDADTLVIGRDGVVTARKDADKTFAGRDARRWVVGHVADMVAQDGARRAGW